MLHQKKVLWQKLTFKIFTFFTFFLSHNHALTIKLTLTSHLSLKNTHSFEPSRYELSIPSSFQNRHQSPHTRTPRFSDGKGLLEMCEAVFRDSSVCRDLGSIFLLSVGRGLAFHELIRDKGPKSGEIDFSRSAVGYISRALILSCMPYGVSVLIEQADLWHRLAP